MGFRASLWFRLLRVREWFIEVIKDETEIVPGTPHLPRDLFQDILVERALLKELKEMQKQTRKIRWQEGARDPLLLQDIKHIEEALNTAGEAVSLHGGSP